MSCVLCPGNTGSMSTLTILFGQNSSKSVPQSLSLGDLSWTPVPDETFLWSNQKPGHSLWQSQPRTSLDASKIQNLP